MLHVVDSFTFNGMLNLECIVLPLGNNKDATPLNATFRTICPLECNPVESVFYKKVFLVSS